MKIDIGITITLEPTRQKLLKFIWEKEEKQTVFPCVNGQKTIHGFLKKNRAIRKSSNNNLKKHILLN
jgi:hypothetical protein